jgi:hypothetical protein
VSFATGEDNVEHRGQLGLRQIQLHSASHNG